MVMRVGNETAVESGEGGGIENHRSLRPRFSHEELHMESKRI